MAPLPGKPCAHTARDDFCPGKLPIFTVKMGSILVSNAALGREHSWGVAILAPEMDLQRLENILHSLEEGKKKPQLYRLKYLVKKPPVVSMIWCHADFCNRLLVLTSTNHSMQTARRCGRCC